MAEFYMPSTATQEYLQGLVQGFYLELSEIGEVVLILKPEPSVLDSIIKGCSIEIFLVNPNIKSRTIIIYIFDSKSEPYHIYHNCFGLEHAVIKGFDEIAIKLALESKHLKLALFNALSHCIFVTDLAINTNAVGFNNWLYKVFNEELYRNPVNRNILANISGSSTQGYSINIENKDHTEEQKISILSPAYEDAWLQNAASTKGVFNYDHYKGDGKHGYQQEFAISAILDRFFKQGKDFFPSPKYNDNGLEFADYLIFNSNAVIVIESKYIISQKITKRHKAILKAITQLNRAESEIIAGNLEFTQDAITERMKKVKLVLKICLLNDRIMLNDENTQDISGKLSKEQLPIFISVSAFFDLLAALGLKNPPLISDNIFYNMIRMYKGFLEGEERICYYQHFSVEGLSAEELNAMGVQKPEL